MRLRTIILSFILIKTSAQISVLSESFTRMILAVKRTQKKKKSCFQNIIPDTLK